MLGQRDDCSDFLYSESLPMPKNVFAWYPFWRQRGRMDLEDLCATVNLEGKQAGGVRGFVHLLLRGIVHLLL